MVAHSTNPIASTSNIDRDGAGLDKEGAGTSPLGSVSALAATGDKEKRKRTEKGSVKPRKKQKKQKKHRDEELNAEDEDEDDDEGEDDVESSGEGLTSDEDEQLPSTRSRKSTKGTTMAPSRFTGNDETSVEAPVNTGHLPSVQLPDLAAVDGDIPHAPVVQESASIAVATPLSTVLPPETLQPPLAPSIQLPAPAAVDEDILRAPAIQESDSVAGAAPLSTVLPPLTIEGLQPPLAVTLPPVDVKWPAWFGKAYAQLTSGDLGPAFTTIILKYVELEKRTGFGIGGAGTGFKSDKRPDEVGWWIARGCKATPKIMIQKLPAFEQAWWAWWKGLQPIARGATEVEGVLHTTHRCPLDGEDAWACVRKHGQNGWYTVLATLFWWATTLGDDRSSHAGWIAAVEDASWVMSQLLGSSDPGSSRYDLMLLSLPDSI